MLRGLLLAGFVPACTSGMTETTVVEQGACTALEGRTFVSQNELECGRSGARCRWQLTFDVDTARTSQFVWQFSDVGDVGQVTCNGSAIIATTSSRTLRATFDAATLRLHWAGETYISQ
jgi:hypothetical protein